jgi:hypothetical protein
MTAGILDGQHGSSCRTVLFSVCEFRQDFLNVILGKIAGIDDRAELIFGEGMIPESFDHSILTESSRHNPIDKCGILQGLQLQLH